MDKHRKNITSLVEVETKIWFRITQQNPRQCYRETRINWQTLLNDSVIVNFPIHNPVNSADEKDNPSTQVMTLNCVVPRKVKMIRKMVYGTCTVSRRGTSSTVDCDLPANADQSSSAPQRVQRHRQTVTAAHLHTDTRTLVMSPLGHVCGLRGL